MSLTPVRSGARALYRCLLGLSVLVAPPAFADPWLAPGDEGLRSDIQMLADEGIVHTPVTSWPLSWGDVAADLERAGHAPLRSAALDDAMARLRLEARRQTRTGVANPHVRLAGAMHPIVVRGFDASPREDGEAEIGTEWIGERFAMRLQTTYVASPADGRHVRFDGSYVGVAVGNLMLSIGYMEKFWGPGWSGSLILSNNARPIPSITIERNFSRPFQTKLLSWLGPWRASFQAGRLESERGDFPNAHFIALRIAAKPLRSLEIGVSRSAQLCGRGRPCTLRTYVDMTLGRSDNDPTLLRQPGNQLAGFDIRWSLPRHIPVAVYAQAIGEDEAGNLPSKYLGLAGVEAWGSVRGWNVRGYAEYASTSCEFSRSQPELGCAYESGIYTDGYRYRGRAIGHAWDRDGRGWTAGFVATRTSLSFTARTYDVRLNRFDGGARHSLTAASSKLSGLELAAGAKTRYGVVRIGAGYDDVSNRAAKLDGGAKAFVEWRNEV